MVRRTLYILLAMHMLVSTLGITVYDRMCNMRGQDRSFSSDMERCCAHHAAQQAPVKRLHGACCAKAAKKAPIKKVEPKPCCGYEATFLKAHAGAPITTEKIALDWSPLAVALIPPALQLPAAPVYLTPKPQVQTSHAPPNGAELRILYQSFLC